jgi:hypothetical protein
MAATGGCRAVGGGTVEGGGPDRATVVVDTGSGPVWSACVSFSGSISGVEALERAASVITDLDPVYDQYTGLGRAVCKLRGVGTAPPDCLGKSVNYWSLSLNGRVTGVGAGGLTIRDGDVEGWRYGTGGTPRAATAGTEAAAAPAVTTTKPPPVTTAPPVATTQPGLSGGGGGGGGGLVVSTAPDGSPLTPAPTRPGETTTTKAGTTTSTKPGDTTTTAPASASETTEPGASDGGSGRSGGKGAGSETAAAAAAAGSGSTGEGGSSGGGSSLPAAAGFVAVLALVGGGAVLVRRRRATAAIGSTASA